MTGKAFPFNARAGSRYGAPMGRRDEGGSREDSFRMKLRRVSLHDGAYDRGGAYWGSAADSMLFCAWSSDREVIRYLRAPSYLFAQEALRLEFPQVDFL